MFFKISKLNEDLYLEVEKYIRLKIQPKPKWLPNFIWRKLLKRLLVLEEIK